MFSKFRSILMKTIDLQLCKKRILPECFVNFKKKKKLEEFAMFPDLQSLSQALRHIENPVKHPRSKPGHS